MAKPPARFVLVVALVCALGCSTGGGRSPPQGNVNRNKCTIAVKGASPVAQACMAGGVKAVRAKMRLLVRTARQNGRSFQCDDCHKDSDATIVLWDHARDAFPKLIAAQ